MLAASLGIALAAPVAFAAGTGSAPSPLLDLPPAQSPVTLTINPDGTAVWDGQPLNGVPALKDKLTHKAQQDPTLELDVHFHNVGQLNDSNRQTLLDVLELAAKFGYVHVQAIPDGARLTVLGPNAVGTATK